MTFQTKVTKTLAISEAICPQYGGNIHIAQNGLIDSDFLTINFNARRVTWYGPCGYKINRTYNLSKTPLHANFCIFRSLSLLSGENVTESHLSVAILLSEFELEIHIVNGEKHEIALPVAVRSLLATPYGLLLCPANTQQRNGGVVIPFTSSVGQHNNLKPNQFLLIYSPQSSIECISQSDINAMNEDQSVACINGDIVLTYSNSTSMVKIYKLQHVVERSRLLDQMELSREHSNVSIEKSFLDPSFDATNNSYMRSNINLSMQSSASHYTAQTMATKSSQSSGRIRATSLERGTSNTYDSETLQVLLGVRTQKGGLNKVTKSPRLSAGSYRSYRSQSPSKQSIAFEDEEIYMEGLDATFETQSSLRLDLLAEAGGKEMGLEGEDLAQYDMQLIKHHGVLMLSVESAKYRQSLLYTVKHNDEKDKWTIEPLWREKTENNYMHSSPAWLTVDNLLLSFCLNDHHQVMARSLFPIALLSNNMMRDCVRLSTLLPSSSSLALYTQESTCIVHCSISPLSNLDSTFLLSFTHSLRREHFSLQLVLESLFLYQTNNGLVWTNKDVILSLVGILTQVALDIVQSHADIAVNKDLYDSLLTHYGEEDNQTDSIVIDILYHLYQEYILQEDYDKAQATSSLLIDIRNLVTHCLDRNHGSIEKLNRWKDYYLSVVQLDSTLPIVSTLNSVFAANKSSPTIQHQVNSIIEQSLIDPLDNPYPMLSILNLFTFKFIENGFANKAQQCNTMPKYMVQAFAAAVLAYANNNNQLKDDVFFWRMCLNNLPSILKSVIELSFESVRVEADMAWPGALLTLLKRNDLVANGPAGDVNDINTTADNQSSSSEDKQLDGLHEVEANSLLRFPEDERVTEACRLLRCSLPVYLKVERAPEDSEQDRRNKLQAKLINLCKRTFACSVGRGMITMGTIQPLMAEALPIPPLCLSGRVPPNNQIITLDSASATPEHLMWPEFHNGVAAAFRLGKQQNSTAVRKVTRNWILYNKTNALQSKTVGENAHAGVLFGLGLLGHLHVLILQEICDYLTQGQETTTVAILIGVAASKIGTCDSVFSKTLSLHLSALLPSQAWDIDISPTVQSASIVGLGLLYCQSGHRLMIEFLLEELSRKPSIVSCDNRESLAICAAWSLGMVLLPHADGFESEQLRDIVDLKIEERLYSLIVGGERPNTSRLFAIDSEIESATGKSSRVLENEIINADITAPAACVALGIVYMKSRNAKILKYLQVPSTSTALDSIRPDRLLYLTLAQSLIEWDNLDPTKLIDRIPAIVKDALDPVQSKLLNKQYTGPYGRVRQSNAFLQPKTAFLLKVNILTGYGLGLGLIHAGTFNEEVKKVLLEQIKWLQSFREGKGFASMGFKAERTHKILVELALSSCSIALACVFAGSGDIDCLRVFRAIRHKVDDVTYGTHMAISMAIGLLFLAGGRCSLKRDPLSIASLLISILPRYPHRPADQQYHLQALRHLYVFAMEPRVLHTIDIDTKQPVSIDLELLLQSGEKVMAHAPGLLPELATVKEIRVVGEKYFSCVRQLKKEERKEKHRENSRTVVLHDSVLLRPLFVKQVENNKGAEKTAEDMLIKNVVDEILATVFSDQAVEEENEMKTDEEQLVSVNEQIGRSILQSSSLLSLVTQYVQNN